MKSTKLKLVALGLMLLSVGTTTAAPRSKAQMQQVAAKAINQHFSSRHMAPRQDMPVALRSEAQLSVYGYAEGGFAVVTNDDLLPAVVGVSENHFSNGDNPNFASWLQAMNDVAEGAVAQNKVLKIITPAPTKYPVAVGPLVESKWDQDEPYDRMTPPYSGSTKCLTGCVATAMAQVMYYHKAPEHGFGEHTMYYSGNAYSADFEHTYYDWDHMLPIYTPGNYSDEEANAVAELMYHCGVSVDMMYGGPYEGSGAYSEDVDGAFRQYFGFSEAQFYGRPSYSDAEWMDLVFKELSENGPLYYGGSDMSRQAGHAFVIHGYREDGLVCVNWGWSGDDDGYYDISLLNPSGYQFSYGQDMVGGVKSVRRAELTDTVVTLQAGDLAQLLPDSLVGRLGSLKVSGPINGADLQILRRLAGRDYYGNATRGALRYLDLSDARIEAGGVYMLQNGKTLSCVADDELPTLVFYACTALKELKLPTTLLSVGDGALARCSGLTDVVLKGAPGCHFVLADGIIWNEDQTEIISVLPVKSGEIDIPSGVVRLHDYALAGCSRVSRVVIPETLTKIGREAFYGCSIMNELRVRTATVPTLTGAGVFTGMQLKQCKLLVRSGMKQKFQSAAQWKDFANEMVVEFGTSVKAHNEIRKYGEKNPTFTYSVSGDPVQGKPSLSCAANSKSDAGRYTIVVNPGTITAEGVDFINGYLIVKPATLKVKVGNYSRYEGQENPEFKLTYSGWKNGDTVDDAFTVLPEVVTEATADSPAGVYDLIIQGGEAPNYTMSYTAGKLTVRPNTQGIDEVEQSAQQPERAYNLDGTRRASRQLGKGVYIINGKKVVK